MSWHDFAASQASPFLSMLSTGKMSTKTTSNKETQQTDTKPERALPGQMLPMECRFDFDHVSPK
jgi:hypothetical protein